MIFVEILGSHRIRRLIIIHYERIELLLTRAPQPVNHSGRFLGWVKLFTEIHRKAAKPNGRKEDERFCSFEKCYQV